MQSQLTNTLSAMLELISTHVSAAFNQNRPTVFFSLMKKNTECVKYRKKYYDYD